ncbi:hypothetical protein EIP86_003330 [Pleurotus ostreatoroseus]|nr:hypothetical protein EIP86_003330 [Pleurotus ostreatoroseus]
MARTTRSLGKEGSFKRIDDFFPRKSQGSVASSSQPSSLPSSSQPRPSQSLSQTTVLSPSQPQTRSKAKVIPTNPKEKRAKTNAPPRAGQEVISISSSRSGPISISDDAGPSHITISSDSDPKSVITISDSTSAEVLQETKMAKVLPSISVAKKTKGKGKAAPKAAAKSSVSTAKAASKAKSPAKPAAASTSSVSAVKTTVRRRSAVEEPMPRKRKLGIRDFDSPSESDEDGIYIPDPERMPESLSHAYKPLEREDLIPESVLKPRGNTPSSVDGHTKSVRTSVSTSSSKRRRLSPPSPPLAPVKNEIPEEGQVPTADITHDRRAQDAAGASSGNEADEEVPSSQSDEHELTIPKAVTKDPAEVKERVDHWRHMSGVSSVSESMVSPQSANAGLPSEAEQPPSSPAVADAPTDADPADIVQEDDQYDYDRMQMDIDFGMADMPPPSYLPTIPDQEEDDEAEVSQQIQLEEPLNDSNETLSTAASYFPTTRPVTPPPLPDTSGSVAIVSGGNSPFKSLDAPHTPMKPKTFSGTPFKPVSDSPFRPLPDAEFFELSSDAKDEPEEEDALPAAPAAPVDSHQRTQDVIAQIKAEAEKRAAMNVKSESEGDVKADLDFDFDSSDSSSDDDELEFKYDFDAKKATPGTSSSVKSPTSSGSSAAGPSTRYNFRQRASPVKSESSSPPEPAPVRRSRPSSGPLAQLLREKNKADKQGFGMEAFEAAEAALAAADARRAAEKAAAKGKGKGKAVARTTRSSKGKMREEMDAEDEDASDGLGLGDFKENLSFRSSDEDEREDEVKAEEAQDSLDAVALLGAGDADAARVRKILRDDRKAAGAKRTEERGVRLFEVVKDESVEAEGDGDGDVMDVDQESRGRGLKLPFSSDELDADPVLSLLRVAVNAHDLSTLCRYLTPILILRVKPQVVDSLVAWLFELSTSHVIAATPSSQDSLLSQRAFELLVAIARRSQPVANLPRLVLQALLRLGADVEPVTEESRHATLSRIVGLVRVFAENNSISPNDLPDLILSLIPIGLEPSTSEELRVDTMVAIDVIGGCIPSTSDGLSPLVRDPTPLVTLLKPVIGSEEIFDIAGNSSKPDCFEDLASHVEILNVALNDIDGYDMAERVKRGKQPARNPYGSPGKSLEKQTELEQVMSLLDRLHGKIGSLAADTRMVDLARSSAKAGLQQLSVRIHFTREANKGRSITKQSSGLTSWLKPKPVPTPTPL